MYFDMTFLTARRVRTFGIVAALALTPIAHASAQVAARTQQLETRASLTERAVREDQAGRRGQAAAIRARLQDGDIQEGDRVVILFENPPGAGRDPNVIVRPDTLLVRFGRVLQFPQARYQGVRDLSVAGLLRSELTDSVRKQFAEVYRNPELRVTALVNLSVTGAVLRGGFIDVPGDFRLNDVLLAAGGITSNANLGKVTIRRGAQLLMSGKDAENALLSGITVDRAQLRAGDQIDIPVKTPTNWLAYVGLGLSLVTVIVTLAR